MRLQHRHGVVLADHPLWKGALPGRDRLQLHRRPCGPTGMPIQRPPRWPQPGRTMAGSAGFPPGASPVSAFDSSAINTPRQLSTSVNGVSTTAS
jgi:hypothetical protein